MLPSDAFNDDREFSRSLNSHLVTSQRIGSCIVYLWNIVGDNGNDNVSIYRFYSYSRIYLVIKLIPSYLGVDGCCYPDLFLLLYRSWNDDGARQLQPIQPQFLQVSHHAQGALLYIFDLKGSADERHGCKIIINNMDWIIKHVASIAGNITLKARANNVSFKW